MRVIIKRTSDYDFRKSREVADASELGKLILKLNKKYRSPIILSREYSQEYDYSLEIYDDYRE